MDNNHRPQRFHQSRGPPPPLQPQPQPPQAQPQPQQYDPNLLLLQSMGMGMGMNLLFPQNQIQNPNLSFPNPNFNNNLNNNFPIHHNPPAFLQHNTPNLSSSPHSFSHNNNNNNNTFINNSTHNQQQQNPNFPLQRNNHSAITADRKVTLDKIEAAIATVRHQFIQAADHISSSKLLQCALVKLQAHSLDSFGFQLHEVPSLHHLTLIEAKINAFIRCYVAAHKIITVFDLQEALCKNEGIQKFEELQLGPFIRHPLVMHYFALTKDVDQVYKISTEEVVNHLSLFLCKKYDKVQIEDFVQFLANHYKVKNPLLLGLRIKSLG